jgi:hypothetical protein
MKAKNTIINVLVVFSGLYIGGWINMFLVQTGPKIIAPPPGVDLTTEEGLIHGMSQMQPQHFLFPYLAHAIGTLVAAVFIALLARSQNFRLSMIPGFAFLIGGIMMVMMLPSPLWFDALDLIGAYIPMSYAGYTIAMKIKSPTIQ